MTYAAECFSILECEGASALRQYFAAADFQRWRPEYSVSGRQVHGFVTMLDE